MTAKHQKSVGLFIPGGCGGREGERLRLPTIPIGDTVAVDDARFGYGSVHKGRTVNIRVYVGVRVGICVRVGIGVRICVGICICIRVGIGICFGICFLVTVGIGVRCAFMVGIEQCEPGVALGFRNVGASCGDERVYWPSANRTLCWEA